MAWLEGLIIPQLKPLYKAMAKKAALIVSLAGRPKEILETPSTVATPSSSFSRLSVSSVVWALPASALTVRASASITMSFLSIP